MELKKFGGRAELKEEALYWCLKEFEKDILNTPVKCERTFRIYETIQENPEHLYKDDIVFKIEEIPVNFTEVVLPGYDYKLEKMPNKKYSFKERIKILFKGELK